MHAIRPSSRNAYDRGAEHPLRPRRTRPPSDRSACTSPSISRYRFHQPDRSETKCRTPSGLHRAGRSIPAVSRPGDQTFTETTPVAIEVRDPQLGPVPRQVRQVPREPCELRAVRARSAASRRSRGRLRRASRHPSRRRGWRRARSRRRRPRAARGRRCRSDPSGVTRPSAYRDAPAGVRRDRHRFAPSSCR